MKDAVPRLFVGVDWATEEHQVCALSTTGSILGEKAFAHSGDGLAEFVEWLEKLSADCLAEVWVAIEVPHGAVVETLLERGCQVFAINPKQLDRFRDRFTIAGSKDDRRDAHVLAASLRTDAPLFRRLRVEEPLVIEIREWSRIHDELTEEKTRLANRVREQLRRYFPQYLELTGDVGEGWFLELWKRIPTPEVARKATANNVARILKRHRIRRLSAREVLETLRRKPVSVAAGTVAASTAHIGLVLDRLAIVGEQLRQCERALDQLLGDTEKSEEEPTDKEKGGELRDVEILQSLPGVGRIVAATLLAEAAQPLRERDYQTLRALSGVAPITVRSGKSWRVIMRQACHQRLRIATYHWARVATQHEPASRALYCALRGRGKTHGGALRVVADRLLRVACSMLRHRTLYDSAKANAKVTLKAPA
jgi:transposase